jgi:ankyrin repeat protein
MSLESTDRNGRTPLLAVVHQENPDAIRRLLQGGADPTAVDSDGLSAEQLAQDSERTQDLLAALRMS